MKSNWLETNHGLNTSNKQEKSETANFLSKYLKNASGKMTSKDQEIICKQDEIEGLNETKKDIETNVYNTRFAILFVYSLNTLMNGALFTGLSPMNNTMTRFYRIDSIWIDWLSNMFLLVFVFISIPFAYLIDRYGIRKNMIFASFFNLVCTILRYLGYKRNRFYFVFIGQLFASVAYVPILQIPGCLSFIWFPDKNRATATSVCFFMNILGVAVGFIQPSLMIHSNYFGVVERQLRLFYFSQFGICLCIFVATAIYFQEKPPLPPSRTPIDKLDVDFFKSLRELTKDINFMLLTQSYGLYFANYVAIIVLVNSLVTMVYPFGYENEVGYMGLICNLFGIAGCYITGILIDRYKSYRLLSFILNGGSLLLLILFASSLTYIPKFSLTFSSYSMLGVFCVPFFAMGIEQAAEMTHPVKASTSSAIMLLIASAYGTVDIFFLGILLRYNLLDHVLIILITCYVISLSLTFFIKTKLKRTEIECS